MPLAPDNPLLTAVDPYQNVPPETDPTLAPPRPYWYAVSQQGVTIHRLSDNSVIYTIPWPATIDVVQPDGSYLNVPAPLEGWEPLSVLVSYPTGEQLVSTSETPATNLYVLMAHSGYEWQSDPAPINLRSPNLRDTIVPMTSAATESAMLVALDVTDPTYDPVTFPMGPTFAGAILGHGAGQLAYEPNSGSVYVGNMPSLSLPTTPAVPNDLTSFVSVIFGLASPAAEAAGGEPGGGVTITPLCGPEHPDEGTLTGVAVVWPCFAEGGEGPFVWEFQGLPSWLIAHPDKLTGVLDGLLYGTPVAGTYTFQARVTDNGQEPPVTSDWVSVTLTVSDLGVAAEAEAEFEVGVAGGIAIEGTGDCTAAPTATPGSLVPQWFDIVTVPGRDNPNPTVPGGIEHTLGCVVMGTPPISGEYYEFTFPNFKFAYPFDREPVVFSGQVGGPYLFDPIPAGATISGLAWHQISKLHDPSTEADILNGEFIGVDPFTSQLYQVLLPQGSIEVGEGTAPPAIQGELDEVSAEGDPLIGTLTTARPDIAAALSAYPNLKVHFGEVAVEVDRDIFVKVDQMLDPTGANPMIIPIGDATIPVGAMMKISGNPATVSVINLAGLQAYGVALDTDFAPAIIGTEPGQTDYGILFVSGKHTGNLAVIDTEAGKAAQVLTVPGSNPSADSVGGVSVNFKTGLAYVADSASQSVQIFGPGTPTGVAPLIVSANATEFTTGSPGWFMVAAIGSPAPALSAAPLPAGVTFTDNGDGTATLAGSPATGLYTFNITAANGTLPNAVQNFTLTVGSITPTCTDGQWQAEYFPNMTATGSPSGARCELAIYNDWGGGGPAGVGVGTDHFSARWTQVHDFGAGGDFTFIATGDDGIRVSLDGTVIIDGWKNQPPTTYSATLPVTGGTHTIVVEYYENTGGAVAQFSYAPSAPLDCGTQWKADYFTNMTLAGSPVGSECVSAIDNNWGSGGPAGAIRVGVNNFSIRWTQVHDFGAGGPYLFTARGDDGIRVSLDGTVLIDGWKDQPPTTYTTMFDVPAGNHEIVVEYYENTGGAVAQFSYAPVPVDCGTGWTAEYFPNMTLLGTPIAIQCESVIDNNWGTGAPAGVLVGADHFSARWTQVHDFGAGGNFTFTATGDDGIRVSLDGAVIIDGWKNQPPTTYSVTVPVSAGNHSIVVEYYENTGGSVARFSYAPFAALDCGTQWKAEYFTNMTLAGTPAGTQCESAINYNWGSGGPTGAILVGNNNFSVRWTQVHDFGAGGDFTFTATGDDGIRVRLDGALIIDGWKDQPPTTYTSTIPVSGGNHTLVVEYYENTGGAVAQFSYAPAL